MVAAGAGRQRQRTQSGFFEGATSVGEDGHHYRYVATRGTRDDPSEFESEIGQGQSALAGSWPGTVALIRALAHHCCSYCGSRPVTPPLLVFQAEVTVTGEIIMPYCVYQYELWISNLGLFRMYRCFH